MADGENFDKDDLKEVLTFLEGFINSPVVRLKIGSDKKIVCSTREFDHICRNRSINNFYFPPLLHAGIGKVERAIQGIFSKQQT